MASAWSQNLPDSTSYKIFRTPGEIVVDGELTDSGWQDIPAGLGFTQNFPLDSVSPYYSTDFKLTYNDQFIYEKRFSMDC